MEEPSSKTLTDRFKRLVVNKRAAVRQTSAASGIIRQYGKKDIWLEDLIVEIDGRHKAVQVRKERQTGQEKRLVQARASIKAPALKWGANDAPTQEDGDSQTGSG